MSEFSHLDAQGRASMVDVSDKPVTLRQATARTFVLMSEDTLSRIKANDVAKGDVLSVARIAGIQAAKRTDELIPLCHSLGLDSVSVRFAFLPGALLIEATARCSGKTGVEMEAMVAASAAALTIYDMCKAVDKAMVVRTTANLRAGPSTDAPRVARVAANRVIPVIGKVKDKDWFKVRLGGGIEGYIFANLLADPKDVATKSFEEAKQKAAAGDAPLEIAPPLMLGPLMQARSPSMATTSPKPIPPFVCGLSSRCESDQFPPASRV